MEMEIELSPLTLTILVVVFLVLLFFVVRTFIAISRRRRSKGLAGELEKLRHKWSQIEISSNKPEHSFQVLAVIEADKLFDYVLKSMMIPGKDFGERLKVVSARYPELKKVWSAHLLRNELVHNMDAEVSENRLKNALQVFKQGLKELGVL